MERLFPANETASYSGAYVTFQPGARTAWHQHPAGQHMIVTSGIALTGTRDGNSIRFAEGDTVWCPPGIDHWHGATPDAAMTHLVITGTKNGQNVIWKENDEFARWYVDLSLCQKIFGFGFAVLKNRFVGYGQASQGFLPRKLYRVSGFGFEFGLAPVIFAVGR